MAFTLFDYQEKLDRDSDLAYEQGYRNVVATSPTGSGKTVVFSHKIEKRDAPSIAIAHRQELTGQMSLALARNDIKHRIIAPKDTINNIIKLHVDEFGQSYYDPKSWRSVAGVKTVLSRKNELSGYLKHIKFWIIDEAHHVLEANEWGRAVALMPEDSNGFLPTATPLRADRKGLGRWCGGVADYMVMGPTMRELIGRERLTEYKIYAPPKVIELAEEDIGVTGDYKQNRLKQEAIEHQDEIVGDIVEHYKRLAYGKKGITFVTDLNTAANVAKAFNQAGIPAEVVSSKTPDLVRASIIKRFINGDLWQLVNVDLFGEGFDVPAVEVVSMARPTMSWALFIQQFGRALRVAPGKDLAIIIDHVGNVVKMSMLYGRPDTFNDYSLEGRQSRAVDDWDKPIPLTNCKNVTVCQNVYERYLKKCPYCGYYEPPKDRSLPEHVDGDLVELDNATLAKLLGEKEEIDAPIPPLEEAVKQYAAQQATKHVPAKYWNHNLKRFRENYPKKVSEKQADKDAQTVLRKNIEWWAGYQKAKGLGYSERCRLFYLSFGMDPLTAQGLTAQAAIELANSITFKIGLLENDRYL